MAHLGFFKAFVANSIDAAFNDASAFISPYCGIRALGRTIPKPTELFGFIYWYYTMLHPNVFDNTFMAGIFCTAAMYALNTGRGFDVCTRTAIGLFREDPDFATQRLNDMRFSNVCPQQITIYDRRIIISLCDAVASLCQVHFYATTQGAATIAIDPVTMCTICRIYFNAQTPCLYRAASPQDIARSSTLWIQFLHRPQEGTRFDPIVISSDDDDDNGNEEQPAAAVEPIDSDSGVGSTNETISITSS